MVPTKHPTLAEVDAYPMPGYLITRMMTEYGYKKIGAEFLVREAKRMLYLCVLSGEDIAPSDNVDDAWHTMLMFTRWYKEFSEFIGGYIHHDPTPPEFWGEEKSKTGIKLTDGTPTYVRMKQNYQKYFGETPDGWAWP